MNYFARTLEPSARAIAAAKRGIRPQHPIIDRVWPSYVGMAKAAILAFLEDCAAAQAIEARRGETHSGSIADESAVETAICKLSHFRPLPSSPDIDRSGLAQEVE